MVNAAEAPTDRGPERPRTAFVLSGGASLGALQVGMLEALYERGIVPDVLVATSVGALNAAFIASRAQTVAAARALARVWRDLRREDVFPVSLSALVGGLCGRRFRRGLGRGFGRRRGRSGRRGLREGHGGDQCGEHGRCRRDGKRACSLPGRRKNQPVIHRQILYLDRFIPARHAGTVAPHLGCVGTKCGRSVTSRSDGAHFHLRISHNVAAL